MEYSSIFYWVFALLLQEFVVNFGTTASDFSFTVPPECAGQVLCEVRPIDYPTEEIDRVSKLLVNRRKRSITTANVPVTPKNFVGERKNCVTKEKVTQPFLVSHNLTQYLVIQSQFLSQYITTVFCKTEGSPCFRSPRHHCETKSSLFCITVYNFELKKSELIKVKVPVDCVCSLKKDNVETDEENTVNNTDSKC